MQSKWNYKNLYNTPPLLDREGTSYSASEAFLPSFYYFPLICTLAWGQNLAGSLEYFCSGKIRCVPKSNASCGLTSIWHSQPFLLQHAPHHPPKNKTKQKTLAERRERKLTFTECPWYAGAFIFWSCVVEIWRKFSISNI